MAYRIAPDQCVACGGCAAECPEQAIRERPPIYVIDAAKCIDCGTCESSCPNGAIAPAE